MTTSLQPPSTRKLAVCASLSLLIVTAACGGDADGGGGSSAGPVYAMMTQVYDDQDRTVYVSLTDTLERGNGVAPDAREFPSVANLAAIDGRVLISSGQEPKITEYEITEDLQWSPGRTLSFLDYPLEDNANFYYQFILDEHTAYLPFEKTKRLIWDPAKMEIRGVVEDSSIPLTKDGLDLQAGGNRNSVRYDGAVMQAFFYVDEDWFRYGGESVLAIYDPETHRESRTITVPCPALSIATRDEAGNTYVGPWDFAGKLALYGDGPAPCVARLKPDLTLDESWTMDLSSWTDGRYLSNFRYIGNGKALANVLHHEELGVRFDGPYDPDVADAIDKSGPHWRLWMFDVEAQRAWPVDGIDVATSSGAQFAVLDGRTFVFLPFDNWGKTMVYELDAEGRASRHFETVGDVFKWVRVR
jgi:hypothetical protein